MAPSSRRTAGFYAGAIFFALFVLFLYGPMVAIFVLSFQGPSGGLTFPMQGVSLRWFAALFEHQMVGDFQMTFVRSLALGLIVMILTMAISLAAGLAFRRRFRGASLLFYVVVASLIIPSILVSLGVGLLFRILDVETAWYTSGLGVHLTWTLPFGLLIMFAVFNRFNKSYEEVARDQGATGWQTLRYVVVPIIAPSLVGIGLLGFTLSYDEFARSLLVVGADLTLPLGVYGMTTNITTPVLYALGTATTIFSFIVIGLFLFTTRMLQRRTQAKRPRAALS